MLRRRLMLDDPLLKRDEHTIVLMHLDGNIVDECGHNFGEDETATYEAGRFGLCRVRGNSAQASISTAASVTIECWIKIKSSDYYPSGNITVFSLYDGGYTIYGIYINPRNLTLGFRTGLKYSSAYGNGTDELAYDTWYHVAIVIYYSGLYNIFVNGRKSQRADNAGKELLFRLANLGQSYYDWLCVDEIRVSNCIRYTEDFTPPTKPYK